MPEPAVAPAKPMVQSVAVQNQSSSNTSHNTNSSVNSMRKVQAAAPSGGSFWRAFFGLDPLPTEQSEVSET
jgi:hypothetical protein